MNREYHKWYSSRLGRDMELLVFGHAGLPVMVFPTSGGRFYEFEDRHMIGALSGRIDGGHLQVYCVDSVDMESWYNRNVPPRWRIARHMQYEDYLFSEVVPLIRLKNQRRASRLARLQLRRLSRRQHRPPPSRHFHRHVVHVRRIRSHQLSPRLLRPGLLLQPAHALPAQPSDPWYFDHYRHNTYILATGWDDQCLGQNQNLDRIMSNKGIPHKLYTWDSYNAHDWPTWERMVREYL